VTGVRFTHVGGPTVLIEAGGWRLLTDPTFDPPGRRYDFGWGTSSVKTAGPALPVEDLGRVDAVLLTHDQHGDNLDDSGRALLASAGTVLTTPGGARRLARCGAVDPTCVVMAAIDWWWRPGPARSEPTCAWPTCAWPTSSGRTCGRR
jgi:L-ascorbate metabolism protein UlaG (beta-lactamase superfamily)